MTHNNYIYIAVMALVSYAIRILPLTLIRKPIKNRFIQSFLYYVPYVTLAVMTFPAIIQATQSPAAGAVALVVGIAAGTCLGIRLKAKEKKIRRGINRAARNVEHAFDNMTR